jgi:uncharacterized membrane protein
MQAATAPAPIRHILIRIRLFGSCALGVATYFLTPATLDTSSRFLIGWNVAIVIFIVLVGIMWARSTHETMRRRAKELDEGRRTVLILAMAAALCSLIAIVVELFNLKHATDAIVALNIGLAVSTIFTAWTFVHLIFTEHYAHGFYLERNGEEAKAESKDPERRGLRFPGQPMPDYVDFLYFSFTIGVANQTADIEIVSRGMRRLVLIHSVISYLFNTIILALTINIAASMIGG